MAEFTKLVITKKGKSLLAKMIAGIGNVKFTKISASDDNIEYTDEQLESLNSLSDVKQTSPISKLTRTNEVSIKVEASFNNKGLTAGYYIKLLGLYAVDPDEGEILYAVTREISGNCYMPAFNGNCSSDIYLQLISNVGCAENVSLEITQPFVPTKEDIEGLEAQIEEFEVQLAGSAEEIEELKNIAGHPAKYQQKITKTNAKTPFELTQSNVDSSKCYLEYYGGSGSPCQLNIYLASGVSFDPDTQYITTCSTPLFQGIIYDDLKSNPSTYLENENNGCTYGEFRFYLYSNDGTLIACWDSSNGCSSTTEITFEDLYDFLCDMQNNYYIKKGSSTYIATSLSEITSDYLMGNTDILLPYAGGYLYEDSEGGAIDFLLNCANNNNALSIRMYKFGVTTSPSAGIGQDISLKANTKYKFSACVKVVSGTVSQISLYIANSTGTKSTIGMKSLDISTNGIISFEFTTESDLTNFKRCYVYNGRHDQTTSRQVLLYNMLLKEI